MCPRRASPAVSRSSSVHPSTEAITLSISYLLASALGVLRNCKKRLVTSRRSTLFSDDSVRNLRKASVRCSFKITARTWVRLGVKG